MARVFVTGLGALSPYGVGVEPLWQGLRSGVAAIGELEFFDASGHRTQLAGEFNDDIHPSRVGLAAQRARLSRSDRFAIAAAREALEDAGLTEAATTVDAGVYLGTSTAGMREGEKVYGEIVAGVRGPRARRRILDAMAQPLGSPAEAVAREFGMRGPVETSGTACAASTIAIETAFWALRSGEVELALVGGTDALCGLTYGGFNSLRAVSPEPCRPFRLEREGLSLGEGAAALVLETEAHARGRGASLLAEVSGAASACDAHHMTAPHPEGRGAMLSVVKALEEAGVAKGAVDFVNAHGTGTPHNDAAEWRALQGVFGEAAARLPVTSTKGAIGHLLGACGAIEALVTVLCLRAGEVHPTPGHGVPDPDCPVDLVVGEPRAIPRARVALSMNLAFGGANAAVVLQLPPDERADA